MEKKTNSKPRGDSAFLRFFRPSMRMYFCILVFFAVLTLVCRNWELGIIELLASALLLLYSRFIHKRQERKVLDYLEKHADGNGAVTEDSECRYGWLLWNVQDRHPRE